MFSLSLVLVHACGCTGKGVGYMPSAISLAASNRDKIKHIRVSTLKESGQNLPAKACILEFEKTATKHDTKMLLPVGPGEGKHIMYMCTAGLFCTSCMNCLQYIHCMYMNLRVRILAYPSDSLQQHTCVSTRKGEGHTSATTKCRQMLRMCSV